MSKIKIGQDVRLSDTALIKMGVKRNENYEKNNRGVVYEIKKLANGTLIGFGSGSYFNENLLEVTTKECDLRKAEMLLREARERQSRCSSSKEM